METVAHAQDAGDHPVHRIVGQAIATSSSWSAKAKYLTRRRVEFAQHVPNMKQTMTKVAKLGSRPGRGNERVQGAPVHLTRFSRERHCGLRGAGGRRRGGTLRRRRRSVERFAQPVELRVGSRVRGGFDRGPGRRSAVEAGLGRSVGASALGRPGFASRRVLQGRRRRRSAGKQRLDLALDLRAGVEHLDAGGRPQRERAAAEGVQAVDVAVSLAQDIGFEALAFGPLSNARLLEPMGRAWIELAIVRGQGRNIAFGLLRR